MFRKGLFSLIILRSNTISFLCYVPEFVGHQNLSDFIDAYDMVFDAMFLSGFLTVYLNRDGHTVHY